MSVGDMVEPRIDRVLTQYRESPKLLHLIRTALRQVQEAAEALDAIPSFFDLDTAVGDQLTKIGKALGWPRTHCISDVQPVFGFECPGVVSDYPIAGFCDDNSTWVDCGFSGFSEITFADDALYRKFLKVRVYQHMRMFDRDSLKAAVKIFWGPTAHVADDSYRQVVVAPGRALTQQEASVLQLYPRVLPIAVGMRIRYHFGTVLPYFGFGEGWGGFCDVRSDSPLLATEAGELVVNGAGEAIASTGGADWICPRTSLPADAVLATYTPDAPPEPKTSSASGYLTMGVPV